MGFWDVHNIALEVWQYPVSYVELVGTVFGLVSVYLASKAHIWTWPTGIVNVVMLFILFFQIQLYADMCLQVYFLAVTLYGWYNWGTNTHEKPIKAFSGLQRMAILVVVLIGTLLSGFLFQNIHVYLPQYFSEPAAFPYIDSFVMVSSIVATVLLAQKRLETWMLWITVDVVCIFLFFEKEVLFLSIEYLIFLGLASYGLWNWNRQLVYE